MARLFGTDGIRGVANEHPMTPELALRLGRAVTFVAGRGLSHAPRIVIGKDTRLSGYMIETAIASGICSMGGRVMLCGPIPTPAVAHLTVSMRADAGIVISASHNPFQDNGIKIFGRDGFKLADDLEAQVSAMVRGRIPLGPRKTGPGIGQAFKVDDARGRYVHPVVVWLIPRRGAVCLTLIVAGRMGSRSACRHQLDDTRHPIILAVPHRSQHVIAMVFPEGATAAGADENGFLLIRNGEEAVKVRYTDPTGIPRVTRFPTSPNPITPMAAFVLHARAESPSDLDAP